MVRIWTCILAVSGVFLALGSHAFAEPTAKDLNRALTAENAKLGIDVKPRELVGDLGYLRRVSVDLIGRIPTREEIDQYLATPAATRREKAVDKLMADPRFVDRWTTFYADLLRLRYNSPGGQAALAFVHQAVADEMPYDEMARRFISANGKAGAVPEVAYVLGDNADPMALAGVTSQVFMGVRISCAQCHNHPFDKWTREDFYGFAAYFGKTRRYENDFTNTVYTQEVSQSIVLWPPAGEGEDSERKPMNPKFLIGLSNASVTPDYIARLEQLRKPKPVAPKDPLAVAAASVDDLLSGADERVKKTAKGKVKDEFDVAGEVKAERESIDLQAEFYNSSELRSELARLIANPRNRYFSRSFVNRVWKDLIGRGIVEPIDDFSDTNPPSHPQLLDFLADEFVAGGFQLKPFVRMLVLSEPYQRSQALGVDSLKREELESAFLAVPARRVLSEVLYDSIVVAGHLFEYKHPQGANTKTVSERIRIAIPREGEAVSPQALAAGGTQMKAQMGTQIASTAGYSLEKGIELDFGAVLKSAKEKAEEAVVVEKMAVKSAEELEAERMQMQAGAGRRMRYIYKTVERTFDDNPIFGSSFRMASPSAPEHFIRVFGQTDRTEVGTPRDHAPSMRQALMMLNGGMTHEASRVGPFEPMHKLLVGEKSNLNEAIALAYLEILTRKPDAEELELATSIVKDGDTLLDGMADLRWVLLNSNEFRYLP
ncbi:MAG: DUF1553 domain-containing protein [Planctomycetota bacterium]|nr:DUF1553 domain-containing protein [Planctomycetota bacterium]MDA1251628.1 DUF1553 domain-containing protein [Planctomycetota bacterium]